MALGHICIHAYTQTYNHIDKHTYSGAHTYRRDTYSQTGCLAQTYIYTNIQADRVAASLTYTHTDIQRQTRQKAKPTYRQAVRLTGRQPASQAVKAHRQTHT